MTLGTLPFTRTQPIARRRRLTRLLFACALTLQLFGPSQGQVPALGWLFAALLPVMFYCLHQLTSDVWIWNRLFRRGSDLDEYELHARHAFTARAYELLHGWPFWLSLAAFLIGGGLLTRFPALNIMENADPTLAAGLFVVKLAVGLDALPRIVAAWSEDDSGEA